MIRVEHAEVGGQQVKWFVVQLGSKLRWFAFGVCIIDVLMAANPAAITGFILDDEFLQLFQVLAIKRNR